MAHISLALLQKECEINVIEKLPSQMSKSSSQGCWAMSAAFSWRAGVPWHSERLGLIESSCRTTTAVRCKTPCAENKRQLWVPEGFAHGFLVLSETADFLYKATDYYAPEHERCILWNDSDLDIDWPLRGEPLMSGKDQAGLLFNAAEVF